jgi:hypothetical protein
MSRVRLRNESEPYYNSMVYTQQQQQQPPGTSPGVERVVSNTPLFDLLKCFFCLAFDLFEI